MDYGEPELSMVPYFNQRGDQGWELVTVQRSKKGMLYIWKRELPPR